MKLGNIQQVQMTGQAAIEAGIFKNKGNWPNEWAVANPDADVFVYFIEETQIGFVLGESAIFETLVDFVASYEEEKQIQESARQWEAEEFDLGYEFAALGGKRGETYSAAWKSGFDSFHADETRSESARFV
jgi:hypothetical protein